MTITGNVKFFFINQIDGSATFSATSADTDLAEYIYDDLLSPRWRSVGSDDVTPEVWTITFSSAKTFNRLFVGNHNIKSGTIKYDSSGYTDFSAPVAWSANAATSNYFEFDSVTTTSIQITMDTTITVNDEKRVGEIRAMTEVETLEVNPESIDFEFSERSNVISTSDGGNVYVFFGSKYNAEYFMSDASYNDMALLRTLKNMGYPFYVYPGGGLTTYTQEGFRVQDMYHVNWINAFKPSIKSNLLGIGTSIRANFAEI